MQCHNLPTGCLIFDSGKLPADKGFNDMQSLNTFSDHAPKPEWIRDFFSDPKFFLEDNRLGIMQITKFKRFLYDCELINRKDKTATEFTALIKKIGWDTPVAWGLIIINLVYNNPQVRWYIKNLPVNEGFARAVVEEKLKTLEVSNKDARSIVKAFKRLCKTPLGTALRFGTTTDDGNKLATLKRTKSRVDDGRVILYALYKFSETTGNKYQFNLSYLMSETDSAGVAPSIIFGIDREETEQFLKGLSTNYPEFINATFTHDLEKISLNSEKNSQDVLKLFDR